MQKTKQTKLRMESIEKVFEQMKNGEGKFHKRTNIFKYMKCVATNECRV